MLILSPPMWAASDRDLVRQLDGELLNKGSEGSLRLRGLIRGQAQHVSSLGSLMIRHPSLFEDQVLGAGDREEEKRGVQTLINRLAAATPFTLEMYLPMRAITGKSYIMARLNFFRMLRHCVDSELADSPGAAALYDEVDRHVSRCVYARVVEELLTSVVCDNTLDLPVRERAARGLAHLWEDRLHFPMREFFPILEHTWEARRRIPVAYGTLGGASEMLGLVAQGCSPDFIRYFASVEASADEAMAFREFLFGLSTEELAEAEKRRAKNAGGVIGAAEIARIAAPVDQVETPRDPATRQFSFFMKRHLEATARAMGGLPGPKRTAEEYVLLAFLAANDPTIFGEG